MPHTFVVQVNHIVFSTKERLPLISPEIRDELHAYTGGILKSEKCRLIKAGGIPDHIHILAELHASLSIASCVQKIKSNTSRWIKTRFPAHRKFGWQEGYAAFSVSPSQIPRVKAYIENQARHHRKKRFTEELRELLQAHNLGCNEEDLSD